MNKIAIILSCCALSIYSCTPKVNEGYRINGVVESVNGIDPNGKQIFLVPLNNPVKEQIDSVVIKNNKFVFTGKDVCIADIRMEKQNRVGYQNLLVVTEPGEIDVIISSNSSSKGSPSNDSLQVFKVLTEQYSQELKELSTKEERISLRESYRRRCTQMKDSLPQGPLKDFLTKMFRD